MSLNSRLAISGKRESGGRVIVNMSKKNSSLNYANGLSSKANNAIKSLITGADRDSPYRKSGR